MTIQEAKEKVVQIANAEVGYKEEKGNVTKYAKFFDDLRKKGIKVYNYPKQGSEWCDIFTDYIFYQAFGEIGMKMLYQPLKDCGAGCRFSAQCYRDNKAFHKVPEVGDQIFFGTKGHEKHTGLVVKVSGAKVYTVEGNKSNRVKDCSYLLTNSSIVGYGRPNWSLASNTPTTSKPKEDPKETPGDVSKTEGVEYKVTADNGLNLRTGPSTDGTRIITTMSKGSVFVVSEIKGKWAKGKWYGLSGWAHTNWLKKKR